jgi:hypothetical protein
VFNKFTWICKKQHFSDDQGWMDFQNLADAQAPAEMPRNDIKGMIVDLFLSLALEDLFLVLLLGISLDTRYSFLEGKKMALELDSQHLPASALTCISSPAHDRQNGRYPSKDEFSNTC